MLSFTSSRVVVLLFLFCELAVGQPANRVTILYDAFGKSPEFTKDWGFSALVEYEGKRILFDTGNNAQIFERNIKSLKVDLRKLDFVVISHRHAERPELSAERESGSEDLHSGRALWLICQGRAQ